MRIALKEPPPPVRPAIAVVGALLIVLPCVVGVATFLLDNKSVPTALVVLLALFLLPVLAGLRRLLRKPRAGELALHEDTIAVQLPGAPPLHAPLLSLRVLSASAGGLVIATEDRAVVVPSASLGISAVDVVTAVHVALRALPGGDALAALLSQREQAAGSVHKRPLLATYGVAVVLALVFAIELASGALSNSRALLDLGAARRDLILAQGGLGWWRIPAAALMHGSLLHLVMNGMTLLMLGPVLERWLSKWRFLVLLLGGALIGTGASALLRENSATVGLSGGLFALLGALLTTSLRYRSAPLTGPRLPARSWLVLVIANVAITLTPGVDAWAHVGGALAGALLALPLTPSLRRFAGRAPERVPSVVRETHARAAALAILALYLAGLVGMALHALG